ncbi:heme exporter protein CcmD [Nitrosococcus halophilus Nc 4]|uniref:Heme exporter protein D n=1 Tax=Nitrosococcus halophilus (strain Nc4) TaxID=472759 RepID=D5BY47_NITHN|nr:heme exporter protein CcmD [Nitrosococcus halophilus]ADE14030.1 heme exporter protein CcmD [Nitrosococcus halophilus Nc 4]
MNILQEFFHMGGYALYVWTAYGIAAIVLVGNIVQARIRQRRITRQIQQEDKS